MTKDGIAEKVRRDLKRAFDDIVKEGTPDWAAQLLAELK